MSLVAALARGTPHVLACFVDVAPSAVPGDSQGQAVMEILGPGQISWLDDELPSLVHVSPRACNLDCRQPLGERMNEVERGLDDNLVSLVNESVAPAPAHTMKKGRNSLIRDRGLSDGISGKRRRTPRSLSRRSRPPTTSN
jgi:hypothetical protein